MSATLIEALQNPELYPHQVEGFQVLETHISWVILTGPYAYKIKKPVNFGFLDFTSLAVRKHYCHEELRLNQRLTDNLYMEVVSISGSAEQPKLGGNDTPIEYAVKMRQFPQSQLLSQIQQDGKLNHEHIQDLATQIANFHLQAPQVAASHPLTDPEAIMAPVRQNFEQIQPLLSDSADLKQLTALADWAEDSFVRLRPLLEQRSANGSIRECHGDIHLGNTTVIDGQVVLFDCIEFNEPFRFIDVVSDAAFLAMDLEDRGLHSFANLFINSWLEQTGDYESLPLLGFYKAYRAMVRAKVNLFRLADAQNTEQQQAILETYRSYANLAESYSNIPVRFLAITHGVSAVGKSTVAMRLVEELGAIRIRSDFERKRLFGEQHGDQHDEVGSGIYNKQASTTTYERLHQLAQIALHAGYPVVLDATYLQLWQREKANQVAQASGVPFLILSCQAPEEVIHGWLEQRRTTGHDISDATAKVVAAQLSSREPLNESEQPHNLTINTNEPESLNKLIQRVQQIFH